MKSTVRAPRTAQFSRYGADVFRRESSRIKAKLARTGEDFRARARDIVKDFHARARDIVEDFRAGGRDIVEDYK